MLIILISACSKHPAHTNSSIDSEPESHEYNSYAVLHDNTSIIFHLHGKKYTYTFPESFRLLAQQDAGQPGDGSLLAVVEIGSGQHPESLAFHSVSTDFDENKSNISAMEIDETMLSFSLANTDSTSDIFNAAYMKAGGGYAVLQKFEEADLHGVTVIYDADNIVWLASSVFFLSHNEVLRLDVIDPFTRGSQLEEHKRKATSIALSFIDENK